MTTIHSTAIVAPGAEVGPDVEVGPYSVIGPNVRLGARTVVMAHAYIDGHTVLGEECTVFPFASLGTRTQDLKFKGGACHVQIGNRTTIREYVTVNAATDDGGYTRVGSDCLLMAYCHVAHDCVVGNEVIIANCGTLAGHVIVEDQVIIGGLCGLHQFVRLGRLCIIGGCSKVTQDVPPFMMADGHPLQVRGINSVGLKRKGVDEEVHKQIKQAYRLLYRQELRTSEALGRIREEIPASPERDHLVEFVTASERGIGK